MKIQIKHINGSIIHEGEYEDIKQAVVTNKNNLSGADLRGAYLCGANLKCAYLCGADLMGANLRGADLMGANLKGADLCGADLRGADLSGSDLRGSVDNFATVSFSGHGEYGRVLTVIVRGEKIELFCGCFYGSVEDLRNYIADGEECLKRTRTLALDTVLMLLNTKND